MAAIGFGGNESKRQRQDVDNRDWKQMLIATKHRRIALGGLGGLTNRTGERPSAAATLQGQMPPAVADAVTLSVDGVHPTSKSTATPGFTGVDLTQFQVPTGLASASVPVLVSINGVDSNTVLLPVQ